MMRISKDFEEKKVPLLGRRGREAHLGLRPGCAGGARYIWNVLLVRHQGASRLRNGVKD